MKSDTMGRAGLVYYQVVSIALVLVMTGFGVSGLWGLAGIAWPSLTVEPYNFRDLRTRADYLQGYTKKNGLYYRTNPSGDPTGLTLDDVTERWRDDHGRALADERARCGRQLALAVIAIAVCLPLYLPHRRVVERARAEKDTA